MPDIQTFDVITMLGAYEQTPRPRTFLRQTMLGGRIKTFSTEQVLIDVRKGARRMAPFVSPIIGGKTMESQGYRTDSYRPPLVVPQDVITPERITPRAAGENIVSGRSPADRIQDEQVRVMNDFDMAITRREEWMCAQLLFTGSITMVGEGVNDLYSVGFDSTETLSGADLWSATTSDPLGDLKTWCLKVAEESGLSPNICIMADNVWEAFKGHAAVQSILDKRNMDPGIISPKPLPSGAIYQGRISELGLEIYTYNEWYIDDTTGASTAMVPANKLAILPSADRNTASMMLYGAFTEMKTRTTYEGARIPRNWVDQGKNAEFIQVVSRPLPTMVDSDCWFVADVL
ncbi:MAG: major capsid protein [Armatimonadota bacterium]